MHEPAFKLAHKLNRKPWVCDECKSDKMLLGSDGRVDCADCGSNEVHRRRIFSLSLGDWLDPEVPVEWLARMLDTIRRCPDVDWLLCTKRPELFHDRLFCVMKLQPRNSLTELVLEWKNGQAPKNIVLLTSVENQAAADLRIPQLLRIPAWRRGLSCEPLLGAVQIKSEWFGDGKISWVIIGGES